MGASGAASARSPDRLGALFARHFAFVWRSLRHLGVAATDADDLAQEVFIVAQRNIDVVDEPARAWLFNVARKLAANERRRRRRAARRREALAASRPSPQPVADTQTENLLALESMLSQLPEEQALVLLLRDVEGFKAREVAESLEIPLNTVSSRLRLARARLERFVRESSRTARVAP